MAHLIEAQLKRFQLDPETFDLAKQIHRQIQVKTGPGSGHELGGGMVSVPAIAAYLACVQYVRVDRMYPRPGVTESHFSLNSGDVDYTTAATASCVRPLMFKKILGIVQDLVEIDPLKSRTEECDADAVTYVELVRAFKLRHYQSVLLGWFESTEAALLGSGELYGSDLKAVKDLTLLRCVVFAWVCEVSKVSSSAGATIITFELKFPCHSPPVSTRRTRNGQTEVRTAQRNLRRSHGGLDRGVFAHQSSDPSRPTSPLKEPHPRILCKPHTF